MQVADLFQTLATGELSNLSLADQTAGDIVVAQKPKILRYANKALIRLYSKFMLREASVNILVDPGITLYKLDAINALTNVSPAPGQVLFIQDSSAAPFQNDVIKIMSIKDTICHTDRPLNDPENCRSFFTPQPKVLQIPDPKCCAGQVFTLLYQAKHVPLVAYTDTIDLPETLEQAMTCYIAHLAYSDLNGQENVAKGQEKLSFFDAICTEVIEQDLANTSYSMTNVRFHKRGWV